MPSVFPWPEGVCGTILFCPQGGKRHCPKKPWLGYINAGPVASPCYEGVCTRMPSFPFVLFFMFTPCHGRHFANHRSGFLGFFLFFSHRSIVPEEKVASFHRLYCRVCRGYRDPGAQGYTVGDQNATQLVKRRRKRKHVAWRKKKVAYRAPAAQACNPPFPIT